jgi:polysaccharide biosynthesis protein PslJ
MTLRQRLRRRARGDASGLVTTYAVLLFGLPAQLVIGPLGASGTPAGVLGVGLVLYWIVMRLVPDSGVARGFQPIRFAVGFFAFSIFVAYAFGVIQPLPPEQLSGADRGLISVMSWVGVAIVTADMLSSREKIEKLIKVLVVLAGIVAFMGLLQFAVGVNLADFYKIPGLKVNYDVAVVSERSDFRRVAATASHPIEFGMVLAMILPIALHTAFYAKTRKSFWWGIVGLIGLTSPMSLSRSAILGLTIAFIVMFFGWPAGRRMAVLLVLPVFVVGLRLLIPGLVGTIKSLFTGITNDDSIKGRTDDYAVVGQFIDKSPFVGRGFGTFLPKDFITLDNQYLGTIIETGYLGLAALIMLFVIGFFTARGIRVRSHDERHRDLAQSLAASISVAALGYVTFDGLGFPMITGLLFLMLGIIGALWRLTRQELASAAAHAAELRRRVEQVRARGGDDALDEGTVVLGRPDEETVVLARPTRRTATAVEEPTVTVQAPVEGPTEVLRSGGDGIDEPTTVLPRRKRAQD